MGLLDSMFGGGTNLTLALDRPTGSPGGVIGGAITLTGGKKPLKLTTLKAHLIYVSVHSKPEGGLPDIETRVVGEQTVAAGIDLAPGSTHNFTFRITLPYDTLPTAHNVTYRVQAVADIPGVKDPSAEVDLKVVELLRRQRTLLVGIDNVHAILTAGGRARRDTLDAFRFLMSEGNVPMVVAGLDVAADIFAEDVELAYRSIIVRLNPWPPGEPSQRLIRVLGQGMQLIEPERLAEPEIAEFLWRHSLGVTGNFKRLLHWGQKVARRHGRECVEFADIREAAQLLPMLIGKSLQAGWRVETGIARRVSATPPVERMYSVVPTPYLASRSCRLPSLAGWRSARARRSSTPFA